MLLLLFLTISALVADPKKLLYTVANPVRGLLNRREKEKEKSGSAPPTPPPPPQAARSGEKKNKNHATHSHVWALRKSALRRSRSGAEVHDCAEGRRGRRGQTSPGGERRNETGKVAIAHGSVEFCEATPIGLTDES